MPRRKILNWYGKNKAMIKGLKELFEKGKVNHRTFVTIRLGSKYADRYNPGDLIHLSISDNPEKPEVIGVAEIWRVQKIYLGELASDDIQKYLKKNIGAKTSIETVRDLSKIYGKLEPADVISIIEFQPKPHWKS